MTALIKVRGLAAGYGDTSAVRGLDLEVHPGEVVALMGPNGAGKTTTVLTLAGELKPLAGEIELMGSSARLPLHRRARRGLALLTEERPVFMGLTARQNIAIGGCDPEKVITLFPELKPLLTRRVGLLSGGEQQMLAVGRALSRHQARLLLIDELSLGLAPKLVTRLLKAVRAAADDGLGVLLVEQYVRRALEISNRVYVIAQGELRFTGTAVEARDKVQDIESMYLSAPQAENPGAMPVTDDRKG